jgi:hypothetical protein
MKRGDPLLLCGVSIAALPQFCLLMELRVFRRFLQINSLGTSNSG